MPRSFALAGLLGGIATLSRNDGVLVLAVLGAAFLWDRLRTCVSALGSPARPARVPLAAALGAVALFAVAVVPWYLRQLAVFGTLSPSTASGKVLFIRDIGEWNSITTPATLDHLLGMGLGPLLLTRVGGLVAAAFIFSVLVGALVLIPPMLVGAWHRRRDPAFGPYFGYAALLFAFSALVSAVHVPGGTFIHSAVALAPHGYVLALWGIVVATAWIARRRTAWDAERAARIFVGAAVAFGVLAAVAGVVLGPRRLGHQAHPDADRCGGAGRGGRAGGRIGSCRSTHPATATGRATRAWSWSTIRWPRWRRSPAPTTSGGWSWNARDSVPAASEILLEGRRPAWVGPPILESTDVSVYPVCTTPADTRCAAAVVTP